MYFFDFNFRVIKKDCWYSVYIIVNYWIYKIINKNFVMDEIFR